MVNPLTERFDLLAPDYDRYTRLSEWLLVRRLRKRLLQNVAGKVLEIGVGTGLNFEHYGDDVTLFGVDVSEAMLAQAQARVDRLDREVYLNVMDAGNLAFPDGAFDAVVSTLTLCSMADISAVLNEMTRVCKPEGKLLFIEHGRSRIRIINFLLDRIATRHYEEHGCRPNLDMERILTESANEQPRPKERGIESGYIMASPQAARKRPSNGNEPGKIQVSCVESHLWGIVKAFWAHPQQ